MWVAIHKCREAMLGVSLHSCLYLRAGKAICLSYYLLCCLFNKSEHNRANRFCQEVVESRCEEDIAQTIYVHVSKCKKIK
jgi:hypothetical protein